MGTACTSCHRIIIARPEWARPGGRTNKLVGWRRMAVMILTVIGASAVIWMYYPYIPDPVVVLFKRPVSDVTSDAVAGQWSMHSHDLQLSGYVTDAPAHPEGHIARSLDLGEATRSAPTVVDGVVYIGGHFKVLAIDAETGETVWEQPTTGPVHASPAVAADMVYLGLLNRQVVALDSNTGNTVWSYRTGDVVPGSAAVDNGIVYIGSHDRNLYAFDAQNGGVIWKAKSTGWVTSPPVIYEGKIFTNSHDGALYIRNSRTGDKRLKYRTRRTLLQPPSAGNGLIYLASGGNILAIDAEARGLPVQYQLDLVWAQLWIWQVPGVPRPSGQPGRKWLVPPDNNDDIFTSAPAVTPEALYVGDTAGLVYSLHPIDGTKQWTFKTSDRIPVKPLVAGDRVYVGTADGNLYALDRFDGQLLWELSLGSPVHTELAFSDGHLYVRTSDGKLHFID